MPTIANLVTMSFTVRIICDKDATDEEQWELAKAQLQHQFALSSMEAVVSIEHDNDSPYGTYDFDHLL